MSSGFPQRLLMCVLLVAAAPSTVAARDSGPVVTATLEALRRQDQRVASVAYRIRTTNIPLCRKVVPLLGWTLHNAPQYGPRLRQAAVRHFRFEGSKPSVMAVVANGPAARAGVARDDVLLSINGKPLGTIAAEGPAGDNRPLQRDKAILDSALAAGPITVRLRNRSGERTLVVRPDNGCRSEAQLDPSTELSAEADGLGVFITTGLVDFTRSDDELAFVLAHEYAHNFLRHREQLRPEGRRGMLSAAPWKVRRTEREADRIGAYIAARAGYDIDVAPEFMERLGRALPQARLALWGHPSVGARVRDLNRIIREIEAKKAAGRPLVP